MHRAVLLSWFCVGCAEGGPSYVLSERAVGQLQIEYPHTSTNLDGSYSIDASSRMEFGSDGRGTWEVRYVHHEDGSSSEEIEEVEVVSYRVDDETWVITVGGVPHMQCRFDDVGLRCVDMSGAVSWWVGE